MGGFCLLAEVDREGSASAACAAGLFRQCLKFGNFTTLLAHAPKTECWILCCKWPLFIELYISLHPFIRKCCSLKSHSRVAWNWNYNWTFFLQTRQYWKGRTTVAPYPASGLQSFLTGQFPFYKVQIFKRLKQVFFKAIFSVFRIFCPGSARIVTCFTGMLRSTRCAGKEVHVIPPKNMFTIVGIPSITGLTFYVSKAGKWR